jgi:hypothetical protein
VSTGLTAYMSSVTQALAQGGGLYAVNLDQSFVCSICNFTRSVRPSVSHSPSP